jgi:hypothetical protein
VHGRLILEEMQERTNSCRKDKSEKVKRSFSEVHVVLVVDPTDT